MVNEDQLMVNEDQLMVNKEDTLGRGLWREELSKVAATPAVPSTFIPHTFESISFGCRNLLHHWVMLEAVKPFV